MNNSLHEHDYKKMLRFMKKSLPSFKKEAYHISKPFIDNIDFLIINFPYFQDINMVSEYFMTDNKDFNRVFSAKFHNFSQIIFYDPNFKYENDKFDYISINKIKLWDGILGRSGKDKLKRSWIRKIDQETGDDIFTLNDPEIVITLFFKIINFQYKNIKRIILDNIDMRKVLQYIYLDDVFIRNALEIKYTNIFSGIKYTPFVFIKYKKYDLLETYLSNIDYKLDNHLNKLNNQSDNEMLDNQLEKDFFYKLFYLFLVEIDYLEYKTLYNILINFNYQVPIFKDLLLKRGAYISDYKYICSTPKYYLYISLISRQSNDLSIEKYLINIFFNNKDEIFLLSNIYEYIIRNNLIEDYIKIIYQGYLDGLSCKVRPKPNVDTLYSFCTKILNKNKLENIKYKEINKINEYIDKCYDDIFVRYICKLVIDEVPSLNIFERDE